MRGRGAAAGAIGAGGNGRAGCAQADGYACWGGWAGTPAGRPRYGGCGTRAPGPGTADQRGTRARPTAGSGCRRVRSRSRAGSSAAPCAGCLVVRRAWQPQPRRDMRQTLGLFPHSLPQQVGQTPGSCSKGGGRLLGPRAQQNAQYLVTSGGQLVDQMAVDLLENAIDYGLFELGCELGIAEIRPESLGDQWHQGGSRNVGRRLGITSRIVCGAGLRPASGAHDVGVV